MLKFFLSCFTFFFFFLFSFSQNNKIKVYFNNPVDNSVSTGQNAIALYYAMDDTLIAYLNRAKYSIDIAMYSWNNAGMLDISAVLNTAFSSGIKIRIIGDSSTNSTGFASLNPGINYLLRPLSAGIMHNKFVIIDANSTNPFDAIVWTGSTNFTAVQMNSDANNVIIFQDQTLAKAFELEFEEMWGDTGLVPNPANAKFGSAKMDNVPHVFNIGGTMVELYFSPSDGTNAKILNAINSSNSDLEFASMVISRSDIASAITGKVSTGVYALGLVDDSSTTSEWNNLKTGMWQDALIDYSASAGIMHHKYLIIDQSNISSDPLVLTGSHNWSTSAETVNDENIVIIHDAAIANLYYQEFVKRFSVNGGAYGITEWQTQNEQLNIVPNPNNGIFSIENFLHPEAMLTLHTVFGEEIHFQFAFSSYPKFDFSFLPAGMYFLTIIAGSEKISGKFIKQ